MLLLFAFFVPNCQYAGISCVFVQYALMNLELLSQKDCTKESSVPSKQPLVHRSVNEWLDILILTDLQIHQRYNQFNRALLMIRRQGM
jgi:hypothetical protein